MFFENYSESFEKLIAKAADLTNKPFIHTVVKKSGEYVFELNEIDISLTILCRDIDGKRIEADDLELEIFKSNNNLVLVVSKLNLPEEPILWSGTKSIWMNSKNGKKCNSPHYSNKLENLATRIKAFMD